MRVAIIKYNAGNVQSVLFALERIGVEAVVTDDISVIQNADKVIFPGVGEAGSAMAYLKQKKLDIVIKNLKQPVLGICLGMQLLCTCTEESNTEGLDIFKTKVNRFKEPKVPHMGWNTINNISTKLFEASSMPQHYYFVHSYYAELCMETASVTEYGTLFSSSLQKDNFYGVQFHPEKSATAGEALLKNFVDL
jgi:imidazole glycerol-phosphate synthase subunit HisH